MVIRKREMACHICKTYSSIFHNQEQIIMFSTFYYFLLQFSPKSTVNNYRQIRLKLLIENIDYLKEEEKNIKHF